MLVFPGMLGKELIIPTPDFNNQVISQSKHQSV